MTVYGYDSWTASVISVGGVKVSMVAFQAVDPGSIPGRRIIFCTHFSFNH